MSSRSFHVRQFFLTCLLAIGAAMPACSQTISDLFNTGVTAAGTPLSTNGVIDAHWTNGVSSPAYTYINGAYHVYSDADYITVDQNAGNAPYMATFNTAFTLPGNADLSTVSIGGNYSIDNILQDILINGHSTGIANGNSVNYTASNSFTLPTGFYRAGANTLSVVWSDLDGPGAIAIEFSGKSFRTLAVPEPGNFVCAIGISLVGVFCTRRRKRVLKSL